VEFTEVAEGVGLGLGVGVGGGGGGGAIAAAWTRVGTIDNVTAMQSAKAIAAAVKILRMPPVFRVRKGLDGQRINVIPVNSAVRQKL